MYLVLLQGAHLVLAVCVFLRVRHILTLRQNKYREISTVSSAKADRLCGTRKCQAIVLRLFLFLSHVCTDLVKYILRFYRDITLIFCSDFLPNKNQAANRGKHTSFLRLSTPLLYRIAAS